MSLPLILGCCWVFAAAGTAMLPMTRQFIPGVALLIVAPLLIGSIGVAHGWPWALFGSFALLSMFRRPLMYFAARATCRPTPETPEET